MQKLFQKESSYLYLILFIASVLRFYNYNNWSFTHDELAALVRLNYNSLSELIREGIQNSDTHPAFVQVLLFTWSKIFGKSEAAIRLPFVIAGIASVALTYFISKKWFGLATACFSSLAIAILDFPILYSQLARPYSFGLFFSLLAVWCWTKLLFGEGKKMLLKTIAYGIATSLCMLTHYFAFFFAMVIAATGFLFLKKENWKYYLLSGVIAILIFLPHIPISLLQFGKGGVGEWLAKPDSNYLWIFMLYAFNDSSFVFIAIIIISLLSLLIYHLDLSFSKFHFICIAWFLLPFLAGYYYSVKVNPVLQYSTLLFSFPFLPIFIFSFFKEGNKKLNNILLISTGLILLYSTIIEQKFYKQETFGVFREIDQAVAGIQKKYGNKNITTVLNTSDRGIFNFYFERWNVTIPYEFYTGDEPDFIRQMLNKMDSCSTTYFLYGWSNFRSPYEIPELIKRKFPCIVYDEKHFNAQITLFKKSDTCKRDIVFFSHIGFEKENINSFEFDSAKIDTAHFHFGSHSLQVESKNEFCITLKTNVSAIFRQNNVVNISAWVFPADTFNTQAVMDIGDNKSHEWKAIILKPFVKAIGKWQEVFATFELPASVFPDEEVKIYLWNPGKNSFCLDDFTVSSFSDSKYDYYAPSFRK